ncbi:flagellar basal-body rod protein FlgF [Desulfosediminicola flagellatus]|uniref:flagellar basal-body rod protein FlgF n=1 Tax=Desulfosediminicola flagellatus TaxID=2569541 RepID=UPI0010AB53C2|nr:flagellar basal-body rod protein FlgF [Desulfosediminicola flagellatus]
MVSGKYSAVAGAVSREQSIANISANLANVNTNGYKRTGMSFESLLRGERQTQEAKGINYNRVRQNITDLTQGGVRETGNPYDLAIAGDGFFKVEGPNGPLYTRRGDFLVDQEGVLRTSNGQAVLNDGNAQITIPDTETGRVTVGEKGTITLVTPDGISAEVGQVAVVGINDRFLLKRETDTTFSLKDGGNEVPPENFQILQGNLELSNVNMTEEMTKLINSYRTFETYHKVLEGFSRLGQVQDELGTIG